MIRLESEETKRHCKSSKYEVICWILKTNITINLLIFTYNININNLLSKHMLLDAMLLNHIQKHSIIVLVILTHPLCRQ